MPVKTQFSFVSTRILSRQDETEDIKISVTLDPLKTEVHVDIIHG